MNHRLIHRWVIVLLMTCCLPLVAAAQAPQKIVTLGSDLTPEQRAALLQRFGAKEGTDTILQVDANEMRAAMKDIIPVPEGYTSVSSTALTCSAPGSGLHVTAENITKVSAAMYAAALITAGVGDGDLIVAAPQDAPAEGMTALAGVFKGLNDGACGRGALDPKRRDLAYRQLALTADLAKTTNNDYTKAADFVLRSQQVLAREKNNPDAANPIVDGVQNDTGITLPPEQRQPLVQLLADMGQAKVDWGTYASGWTLQQISATEVRVTPTNVGTGSTDGARTFVGTVKEANPLVISVPGNANELRLDGTNVEITRNGKPAQYTDLQPSDAITLTVGTNNVVSRIVASTGKPGVALRSVVGVVNDLTDGTLTVTTNNGKQRFATAKVPVQRNGKAAKITDIQAGDNVSIQLSARGEPTLILATSGNGAGAASGLMGQVRRYGWLCLLPLLLLLLIPFLRRRQRDRETLLVEPEQRSVVTDEAAEDDDFNL